MRNLILGGAAALALAACGDAATSDKRTTTEVVAANPISDQLKTMSPLYRFLGLRRGIVESGQSCKRIDRAAYQQQYQTMAMWVAHCIDSGDWAIFIAPNADVQARKCADAATLGIPACRPVAAEPAPAPAQ